VDLIRCSQAAALLQAFHRFTMGGGDPAHVPFGCVPDIDRPSRFGQQLFRLGGPRERVNDLAVRLAEIARHVAAIFLEVAELIHDFKAAHLLMRRHEIVGEVTRDVWV